MSDGILYGVLPAGIAMAPKIIENAPVMFENSFNKGFESLGNTINKTEGFNFKLKPDIHGFAGDPGKLTADLTKAASSQSFENTKGLLRQAGNLDKTRTAHTNAANAATQMQNAANGTQASKWATALKWLNEPSKRMVSAGEKLIQGGTLPIKAAENSSKIGLMAKNASATSKAFAGNALKNIPRFGWLAGAIESVFQIGDMADGIAEGNGRWVSQTARSATKVAGAVGVAVGAAKIGALVGSVVPGAGTLAGAAAGFVVGLGASLVAGWLGMKAVNGVADGLFGKNKKELAAAGTTAVAQPQAAANPYAMPTAAINDFDFSSDPQLYQMLYGPGGVYAAA